MPPCPLLDDPAARLYLLNNTLDSSLDTAASHSAAPALYPADRRPPSANTKSSFVARHNPAKLLGHPR